VIQNHTPAMTKDEYLTFQSNIFKTEVYDGAKGLSEIK
jgi:hypothetical protein